MINVWGPPHFWLLALVIFWFSSLRKLQLQGLGFTHQARLYVGVVLRWCLWSFTSSSSASLSFTRRGHFGPRFKATC